MLAAHKFRQIIMPELKRIVKADIVIPHHCRRNQRNRYPCLPLAEQRCKLAHAALPVFSIEPCHKRRERHRRERAAAHRKRNQRIRKRLPVLICSYCR